MRLITVIAILALLAGCETPGNNRDLRLSRNAQEAEAALAAGADIEAKDPYNTTPLMSAAHAGRLDVVKYLVSRGANVNARNSGGDTALTWAEETGHSDIASFLKTQGAKTNAASDVPPKRAVIEAKGGCLNEKLADCVSNLQASFKFEEWVPDYIKEQIRHNAELDVNGRRTSRDNILRIKVITRGVFLINHITIEYNDDNYVTAARMTLWADPSEAQTPSEFAGTGLYEAVLTLIGSKCGEVTSAGVPQFFFNTVRPTIKVQRSKEKHEITYEVLYERTSSKIKFCGYDFEYYSADSYDTAHRSKANPHGFSRYSSVLFTSIPLSGR